MKKFLISIISKFFLTYFSFRYGKKVQFKKNITINWRFKFSGKGTLVIGDNCNLWAHEEYNRFQTYSPEAHISIGKNSRLNGVLLQSRKKISIGAQCLVGSAIIMDTDFHHADPAKRWHTTNIPTEPVTIGDNVWLAGQSVVLKGVEIEKNSIVAFRAVVSKNVEKNTIVAGNPAQVVKKI